MTKSAIVSGLYQRILRPAIKRVWLAAIRSAARERERERAALLIRERGLIRRGNDAGRAGSRGTMAADPPRRKCKIYQFARARARPPRRSARTHRRDKNARRARRKSLAEISLPAVVNAIPPATMVPGFRGE